MKHLLFALLFTGIGCMAQPKTIVRDSIWPLMKDTTYILDSSGMRYWGHSWDQTKKIHKKYDTSVKWGLINIKDTGDTKSYTYMRMAWYRMITDGGFDDLVGRGDVQYYRTNKLLAGCNIKDTIPQYIIIYRDYLEKIGYEQRQYYVGWNWLYTKDVKKGTP